MAARFRFRLETVRRLRESLEEDAQRVLARALQEEQRVREHLEALQSLQRETAAQRRGEPGQVVDLDRWRATERFLVVLERRLREAFAQWREANQAVAAARQALQKAHRDHQILVRLKERRALQHAQEQARIDAIALDELAILRHRFHAPSAGGLP